MEVRTFLGLTAFTFIEMVNGNDQEGGTRSANLQPGPDHGFKLLASWP